MLEIQIIDQQITLGNLSKIASQQFGDMVKFVVDVEKEIIAIGGELHADEEAALLETGSMQENLWGINYYPENAGVNRIEFDSMINIRPSQNNRSREVEDETLRERITQIVNKLVVA